MQVTFYGVRGSTPSPVEKNHRYGGNTSCVAVETGNDDPIVLDLGTGLRSWGETFPADRSFRGHALVTHMHWDHVQGLPFFVPLLRHGARIDIYGPAPEQNSLEQCFQSFLAPPYFPVTVAELPGSIFFHEVADTRFRIGETTVSSRRVPHIGATNGYRIETEGVSMAYVPDHQMPDDPTFVDEAVLELCDGVDLLVHDAQYTPEEFEAKRNWGHCTVDYAVRVGIEARAKLLALFHHDPSHPDEMVDCLLAGARVSAGNAIPEIVAAAEGLTIVL